MRIFASLLLRLLFYRISMYRFSDEEKEVFNEIYEEALTRTGYIPYECPYPKYRFLQFLSSSKNVLFHGSNNKEFYFFSLSAETMNNEPWTDGVVYILPREPFDKVGKGSVTFDEWICKQPIKPILKIEVEPKDFVFINKVSIHRSRESIIKTWILYKFRTWGGHSRGDFL